MTQQKSNYVCYLFDSEEVVWEPKQIPNAWVRFWMRVFFNCRWVKKL